MPRALEAAGKCGQSLRGSRGQAQEAPSPCPEARGSTRVAWEAPSTGASPREAPPPGPRLSGRSLVCPTTPEVLDVTEEEEPPPEHRLSGLSLVRPATPEALDVSQEEEPPPGPRLSGLSLVCPSAPEEPPETLYAGQEEVALWQLGWGRVLAASLAGALWLFAGLCLLGLGERLLVQDRRLTVLRAAGWAVFYVLPFQVCSCNIAGFIVYGLMPGPAWWRQLLIPTMSPAKLAAYAGESGHALWRVVAGSIWFFGMPFTSAALLVMAPIGGGAEHFGLFVIYGVAGNLVRPMSSLGLSKLLPGRAGSQSYAKGLALASMGFIIIGFFALVGIHGVASRYLHLWPDLLIIPLLTAYECLGVFIVRNRFVGRFVADPHVSRSYAGTPQGIVPSLLVAMLHGNAEAARMALLLKSASYGADVPRLVGCLIASGCLNVLNRTGWLFKVLQLILGVRRLSFTTLMSLWNLAKFKMGYPRFLALGSVMLARVSLGHELLPCENFWVAGAFLVQEVFEDAAVCLACGLGLDAFSRFAKPEAPGSAATAFSGIQPCPHEVSKDGLSHDDVAWASNESKDYANIEQEIFAFEHLEPESLEVLPLWAHFLAIFPAQLHLVLCCAFSGWGMPALLGFCPVELPDGTAWLSHGLLWWPALKAANVCGGSQ